MPPTEDALPRVRATCRAALAVPGCPVTVIDNAVRAFARDTLPALLTGAGAAGGSDGVDLPLRFDSVDEELDAAFLHALLALGSGFRKELHAAVGAGAADSMLRGILGMYLTGRKPTAAALRDLSVADVAEAFALPVDVEVPAAPNLPFALISRPGPLRPLAGHVASVLNSAGAALLNRGHASFAAWLRAQAAANAYHDLSTGAPEAGRLAGLLADTFPGMRDVSPVGGTWLLKKAQLCVKELHRKFATREPALCGFAGGVRGLTVFADNVIPAVLRQAGVLRYTEPLAAAVEGGKELPAASDADVPLRAGAVVACEAIVAAAHEYAAELQAGAAGETAGAGGSGGDAAGAAAALAGLSEAALDGLLWRLGKTPAYRALPRHATKDTVFY